METAASPCRKGLIYILTSPSGKSYVGQTTTSLEKRFRAHVNAARQGTRTVIYNAIRKYGEGGFAVRVIEETDELDAAEDFWITILGTLVPNGYNARTGGSSGYTYTQEAKDKISRANTGRVRPQHEKDRISNTMRGVKKSEETRRRMCEAQKGTRPTESTILSAVLANSKPVIARNVATGEIKNFCNGVTASAFFNMSKPWAHSAIAKRRVSRAGWTLQYAD